ncbi:MAG: DUF615 domain-containing protein [Proteobacteria bacterium]|nr:DUF615 domain-containing protein [Pseudomonadota bacterium]MBU1716787.1 DUF615 domain-containing protein [Pseudomonadota bacterium]
MDSSISRSEKKRQSKRIEELSRELCELPNSAIAKLPCEKFLKDEIIHAKTVKGGALKRQIKFIAKELRNSSPDPFFEFLELNRGSKLKKDREFHELERLRDAIITEAFAALQEARVTNRDFEFGHDNSSLHNVTSHFPEIDIATIALSAKRYAVTRKPSHSREIFRLLKAAAEREKFSAPKQEKD